MERRVCDEDKEEHEEEKEREQGRVNTQQED